MTDALSKYPHFAVLATWERVRATGSKYGRLSQVLKTAKRSALNAGPAQALLVP